MNEQKTVEVVASKESRSSEDNCGQRRKREPLPLEGLRQAEALLELILTAARQRYTGRSCMVDIGGPSDKRLYRVDLREGVITYIARSESRVSLEAAWRRRILRGLAKRLGVVGDLT